MQEKRKMRRFPVKRNVSLIDSLVSSSAGLQQFDAQIPQSKFFLEYLERGGAIEDLPRVGVHPVLDLPYGPSLDTREIRPFGKESPDDPIVILISATFRGAIRMGEIQYGPFPLGKYRLLQARDIGELGSVLVFFSRTGIARMLSVG